MVGPHVNAQKTAVIYDRGKYVREKNKGKKVDTDSGRQLVLFL